MLFDLDFEDDVTIRLDAPERLPAEPPALPFPLVCVRLVEDPDDGDPILLVRRRAA